MPILFGARGRCLGLGGPRRAHGLANDSDGERPGWKQTRKRPLGFIPGAPKRPPQPRAHRAAMGNGRKNRAQAQRPRSTPRVTCRLAQAGLPRVGLGRRSGNHYDGAQTARQPRGGPWPGSDFVLELPRFPHGARCPMPGAHDDTIACRP